MTPDDRYEDDFEPPSPSRYDGEDATPTETDFSDDLYGNSLSGLLGAGQETPPPDSLADDIDKWQPPSPEHLHELLREAQIEVHHLIGRGGMGAVYQGRQVKLNRIVAVKVLPPELAQSEDFVGRFKREAQVLASLTYPSIVAIYDFGQTAEGHLYFVMEYVHGTDLAKFIRSGQLTADLALKLTAQICDALQFAHEHGVIHRDIKPANVLVTSDGRQAKLADFGLAMRPADLDDLDAPIPDLPVPEGKATPLRPLDPIGLRYTRTGHGMGTPPYAAPEVYAGVADVRSDIFALGIMLYELLTGSPPEPRYILPSQKIGTTTALDDVVMKALEGEPNDRFQSATEMRQAVEQATQPLSSQLALAAPVEVIPPQSQVLATSHQSLRQQQALAAQREAYRAQAQAVKRRSWLSRLITLTSLALIAAIAFDAGQHWVQAKRLVLFVSALLPKAQSLPTEPAPVAVFHAAQPAPEQVLRQSQATTSHVIPTDAKRFQGKHFRLYKERLSWDAAKLRCEALGGQLAIVPNQPTWDAVRTLIDDKGTYLLGATDGTPKGSWKWLDGTPITFSFWMNRYTRADHGDRDNYLCIDNYWPGTVWRSLPNDGNQGSCHVAGFICEWSDTAGNGKSLPVPATQLTADQAAFDKELRAHSWLIPSRNWVIEFKDNHEAKVDEGDGIRTWHWWIVGQRTLHIQFSVQPATFDASIGGTYIFGSDMMSFQGANGNPLGVRHKSLATPASTSSQAIEPDFTPLLDKNHQEGWRYVGPGEINQDNGIFSVWLPNPKSTDAGMYWYVRRTFADFVLRLEFMTTNKEVNSGVFIRLPTLRNGPQTLWFDGSYEFEIKGAETGFILPGKPKLDVTSPYKANTWNDYEITAQGHDYTVKLNGLLINKHSGNRNTSGYIAIQSFTDHLNDFRFRNVRIKELSSAAPINTSQSIDVKLDYLAKGAYLKAQAYRPLFGPTTGKRPSSIAKAPNDISTAKFGDTMAVYGEIKMGRPGSERTHAFIWDKAHSNSQRLFVDSNANGDLTDDPPAKWEPRPIKSNDGSKAPLYGGAFQLDIKCGDESQVAYFSAYIIERFDPGDDPNAYHTRFVFYPDYARSGTVTINGKATLAMLTDAEGKGDFSSPTNSLLLDINGDGRFDWTTEAFMIKDPFKLGSTTCEIAGLTANGASFQIVKSKRDITK